MKHLLLLFSTTFWHCYQQQQWQYYCCCCCCCQPHSHPTGSGLNLHLLANCQCGNKSSDSIGIFQSFNTWVLEYHVRVSITLMFEHMNIWLFGYFDVFSLKHFHIWIFSSDAVVRFFAIMFPQPAIAAPILQISSLKKQKNVKMSLCECFRWQWVEKNKGLNISTNI